MGIQNIYFLSQKVELVILAKKLILHLIDLIKIIKITHKF